MAFINARTDCEFRSNWLASQDSISTPSAPDKAPTLGDVIRHMSKRAWGLSGLVLGIVAVLVAVGSLILAGVLSFNRDGLVSLDPESVAAQLVSELDKQAVTATVECPATLVAPVGFSFICMAQGEQASVAQINVTIVDSLGELGWHLISDLPARTP